MNAVTRALSRFANAAALPAGPARRAFADGRYADARRLLPAMRVRGEARAATVLLRAESLAALGLHKDARRLHRRAIRETGGHPLARALCGRLLMDSGDPEGAAHQLELARRRERELDKDMRALMIAWSALAFAALGRTTSLKGALQRLDETRAPGAGALAMRAVLSMNQGDLAGAKRFLKRARRADNICAGVLASAANLSFVTGDASWARRYLERALAREPHRVVLHLLLGVALQTAGKPQAAAAAYAAAREIAPRGCHADHALLSEGNCLHLMGRGRGALRAWRALLENHPKSALRKEARCFIRASSRQRRDDAGAVRVVLDRFPRGVQRPDECGPTTLSCVLEYWGHSVSRRAVARAVMSGATPWHALASYARAKGLAALCVRADAGELRALAMRGVPAIISEHHGMDGHFLASIGFDRAKDVIIAQDPRFQERSEIMERDLDAHRRHDDCLALLALPRKETRRLDGLALKDAGFFERGLNAARLRDSGKLARARAALEKLCAARPGSAMAARLLVETHFAQRRFDAAEQVCRGFLEKSPREFWALKYLGDSVFARQRFSDAVEFYRRARRVFPRDASLLLLLGHALRQTGKLGEATRMLREASRWDTPTAALLVARAEVSLARGDSQRASRHLRIALDMDPRDELAGCLPAAPRAERG